MSRLAMRTPRLLLVAVPAALLWAAVAASTASSEIVVDFSHVEHMTRQPDASCTDCHLVTDATSAAPGWNRAACVTCHDAQVPVYTPRARGKQLAVDFAHGDHRGRVDCVACHKRQSEKIGGNNLPFTRPGKKECFACHAAAQGNPPRETSCASCHGRDQRREKPSTHDATWTRTHGVHADPFHSFEHGQACTTCHKENACVACHHSERPRDHTALWRERSHGTAAAWDQNRCKTCHETNQCISCHQNNAPRNHRGAWQATHGLVARSRGDASCLACHRPPECISCHAGNPQ